MDLNGKRVIVVGLGKSGRAAARLCAERGARVLATDSAPAERLPPEVSSLGVQLVLGGHAGVPFADADLVVVSPGVPPLAELTRAEARGVEVIGELELAARLLAVPVLAVGGTNGKSTTTTLLGEVLRAAGLRAFVGGNLGTPAAEAVGRELDVALFEVSSFQLERAPRFRPRVSVLLNITEDHLDRYPDFATYAAAKGQAFVNQGPGDVAVVPSGDNEPARQAARGRGRKVTFGELADFAVEAEGVVERESGERYELSGSELHGRHNLDNAAAAIAAAQSFGVSPEAIRRGLATFRALPHRMALVGQARGVRFYDDSKGTNVGAAVTALLGLSEPRAVLIAGGRDKHGSYEPLVQALEQKGRALVVIGEAAERIAAATGGILPVSRASSMEQAVTLAFRSAAPGDAVLLSPACSSFDMFSSYADRGDQFARAVRGLLASVEGGGG